MVSQNTRVMPTEFSLKAKSQCMALVAQPWCWRSVGSFLSQELGKLLGNSLKSESWPFYLLMDTKPTSGENDRTAIIPSLPCLELIINSLWKSTEESLNENTLHGKSAWKGRRWTHSGLRSWDYLSFHYPAIASESSDRLKGNLLSMTSGCS